MRRALCVGIDRYHFGDLRGCVSDAERMTDLLRNHYDNSPNFDVRVLTAPLGGADTTVTRAVLREDIEKLLKPKAEVALLYFAGHGTANNLDGYVVTQDAQKYDEGVGMNDILKLANESAADEVVILLDCCHSGLLGNPPTLDNSRAVLREGISILTASRGDQISVEEAGGGIFTSLVVDGLQGGAADLLGNVSAPALYGFVEAALGAWDQRPLFKSHVSQVVSLRCCSPPIDRTLLRKLHTLFPLPAEPLPLDPSFEESSPNANSLNVSIFQELQQLARVHLVAPVGAPHMYGAAMNSKACALTPSGRYHWRLARDGRI